MFSSMSGDKNVSRRVGEVAEIFGLQDRLDTISHLLSQGEKKLLDVASAFALDPEVILLDEPTSGISTNDKHRVMRTLIAAADRAGVKAMILVEHDMDLVATYSDRIIAIAEGKVLADQPPKEFFANPAVIEIVVGKKRGK
jgi:branched-chain amino acid transport system ATP-binding protein